MSETEQTIVNEPKKKNRRRMFGVIGGLILVVGAIGGFIYYKYSSSHIYIDKAEITAPAIQLGPSVPGTLQEVMVKEGDVVPSDTVVARVDNSLIKTKVAGIIVDVNSDIGKRFNPGEAVVTMIDPNELHVVGSLAEDKGLNQVKVGQKVLFTVDAYGGKQFYGVVDEVSPTSKQSGVVFNISDQRESKEFDIKARYDNNAYADLKNGMSARMWVLK